MLSRSIYATPGRRSFGNFGTLPDDDEFAGLQVAEYAITEWREPVAFPSIGYLTVRGKGKRKAMSSLFLGLQLFHPTEAPDTTAVRGSWCCKQKHLFDYIKRNLLSAGVLSKIARLLPDDYIFCPFWKDVGPLGMFEPSFKHLHGDDDYTDPDAERLPAAIVVVNGVYTYVDLDPAQTTIQSFVDMLDVEAKGWITEVHPPPPTGLIPLEPTFTTIKKVRRPPSNHPDGAPSLLLAGVGHCRAKVRR